MKWVKFSLMVTVPVLIFAFLYCPVFHAMPRFMERYDADPYAKADLRGRCTICHVSEDGFGPLTAFGKAFAENGYRITEELRAQFPDVFALGGKGAQPASPSKPEFAAKEFFMANCALCHGNDGRGGVNPALPVPDFADAAWQTKATDRKLAEVISKGKGLMPAWKEKLSQDQILAMVKLVRQFAKNQP